MINDSFFLCFFFFFFFFFFFCARNISKGKQLKLSEHNWVTSLHRSREPEYPKWHPKLSIRKFLVFKRSLSAGFDWNYLLDIAHRCKLFHWAILIQFQLGNMVTTWLNAIYPWCLGKLPQRQTERVLCRPLHMHGTCRDLYCTPFISR